MAAVISNGGGYSSTFAYVSECRRMGLEVLPPDVNDSDRAYAGRDRRVRVGLMQIKGLRDEAVEAIVAERGSGGPVAPLDAFLRRVPVDPPDAPPRILPRAFDGAGVRAGAAAPRARICPG